MADYDCWPLWGVSNIGNIDPATLPLSSVLEKDLLNWARQYDATLNRSDPVQSGFRTREEAQAFNEEGWALWERLRVELEDIKVVYFDNELGRVFEERPEGARASQPHFLFEK
ncbi:hypothetical protein PUV47_18960 [Pseudovibrio exalbescens]|uniref:hypothetical protein n=1 Tax=Pseudovibrio exalbescens TaxID=197461 RepID=UPI00236614FA|nr:hypothetical protein [Pseudovibrio exalbescens]MDD7912017.1 hypothetical protein [Pseudovibrio exalbescens]